MLEIREVSKIFNATTVNEKIAINNLSLTVNDNEFVTVIGGNGAGKSTLLNLISGALFPDSGKILLNGRDITRIPDFKRAKFIGRVFQDPNMGTSADMLIEENLALSLRRGRVRTLKWGIQESERQFFRDELSKFDLGLENRLNTKVGLLSGGQRQALTLLMAVMIKPELLLLDEHTAALDPKTASNVLKMTDEVVRENHLTTLMITHNMKDAIEYGNRLIMMNEGKIVLDISGSEKEKMTVPYLLELFSKVSGSSEANDKLLLS